MIPGAKAAVAAALREDLAGGDVTTDLVVPAGAAGRGRIVAREALVVCGLEVAAEVFAQVDDRVTLTPRAADGDAVDAGAVLAEVAGPLRALLSGERTALNFLQRLSGVATWTRRHVDALGEAAARVRLVDTRKTTPGLRGLEKHAVSCGGAHNHRLSLHHGVMIKDNHLVAAGGVAEAVAAARAGAHHLLKIQCEVDTIEQAREAVAAGVDVLLLDNFDIGALAAAVAELRRIAPSVALEASGGVRLETLPAIAATGVDVISCGALVHQARWVDVALDLDA